MFTKDLFKNYIYPIVTISGSIIGVGFLSLPYVGSKIGVLPMILYLVALFFLVTKIHLIFGEISLKTPDFKRFPGFVGYYLGNKWKVFAFVSSIIGYFGILLLYLIIGSQFLTAVLSPIIGGGVLFYVLCYIFLAAAIIFFGIKVIAKVELVSVLLLFLAIIFIFAKGFFDIKLGNIIDIPQNWLAVKNLFLPYGPILFALWGVGLIPESEELLRGNKKLMKRVIIVSTLVPAIIYVLFIVLVVSITGTHTSESALIGLKNFLGSGIISISLLIGAMVTFVAFIVHGMTFKKILTYDLKIKNWHAMVIVCLTPLILLFLGFNSFFSLISFMGGVLLGIDGILILFMYKKIINKSIIIYPLSLIFLAGIIYQIIYFTN